MEGHKGHLWTNQYQFFKKIRNKKRKKRNERGKIESEKVSWN
jgi:hypothetical protein